MIRCRFFRHGVYNNNYVSEVFCIPVQILFALYPRCHIGPNSPHRYELFGGHMAAHCEARDYAKVREPNYFGH